MFSKKNLTPRQLSFITAVVIAVPVSVLILLIEQNWIWGAGTFVVVLGGSYLLVSFLLEQFIYRKIKLIYKFIYTTKATRKEEMYYKYILPRKSIDEVREDVEAWAEKRNEEIELLKKNEQFRKEFLQNLSHEFKTPVFAIQGYVESLLAGALSNPDMAKRFLENTSRNVERLSSLIRDLDEISKLERGELELNRSVFVIQNLLRELFESLSLLSDEKQISFQIKKGCESPIEVWADKEKLRQVFINLIDNSCKYGKPGSTITASIYPAEDNRVLVEISDEGIGIPEKHLPRIFERFYRTEEGRRLDISGSGLGLAICKHIIEAHGQNIHIRSTENVGTTVGFTLPAGKDQ